MAWIITRQNGIVNDAFVQKIARFKDGRIVLYGGHGDELGEVLGEFRSYETPDQAILTPAQWFDRQARP